MTAFLDDNKEGVSLEELMRFVWSDGCLLGMLGAFADESGTQEQSPILVVSMYVAPTDWWTRFRCAWSSDVLRGAPFFHMKEAVRHLGHDADWNERLGAAVRAIRNHTRVAVATVVDLAAYEDFRRKLREVMPKWFADAAPYTFCAIDCLRQIKLWLDENGPEDQITYVFEAGHKNWGGVREFLETAMEDRVQRQILRLATFFPATKRERIELQAADLYAFWIREYAEAVDYRKQPYSIHPLTRELVQAVHRYNYWGADRLDKYLSACSEAARETQWWKYR